MTNSHKVHSVRGKSVSLPTAGETLHVSIPKLSEESHRFVRFDYVSWCIFRWWAPTPTNLCAWIETDMMKLLQTKRKYPACASWAYKREIRSPWLTETHKVLGEPVVHWLHLRFIIIRFDNNCHLNELKEFTWGKIKQYSLIIFLLWRKFTIWIAIDNATFWWLGFWFIFIFEFESNKFELFWEYCWHNLSFFVYMLLYLNVIKC